MFPKTNFCMFTTVASLQLEVKVVCCDNERYIVIC